MKPFFVIGNWKSNKTLAEAEGWLTDFARIIHGTPLKPENLEVILCVPFVHIPVLKQLLKDASFPFPFYLGAQNVSSFSDGAYTGEISARMLSGLATHCLIGHSERRKYFGETDMQIGEKAKQLQEHGIEPIVCIPDEKTPVPPGVTFIGYEPVWAIGTGIADTPEHANTVAGTITSTHPQSRVIYGGSVMPENVGGFASQTHISGILPGGASLDPMKFFELLSHVRVQS